MKITKKQCIEAVTIEPLTYGEFFSLDYRKVKTLSGIRSDFVYMKKSKLHNTCNVCAVGAVMRGCKITHKDAESLTKKDYCSVPYYRDLYITVEQKTNDLNYLSALSIYHETLCNWEVGKLTDNSQKIKYASSDVHRAELVNFIECFFPDSFEV